MSYVRIVYVRVYVYVHVYVRVSVHVFVHVSVRAKQPGCAITEKTV